MESTPDLPVPTEPKPRMGTAIKNVLQTLKEVKSRPPTKEQINALYTVKAVCDGTVYQIENPTKEILYLMQGRGWNEAMAVAGQSTPDTLECFDDLYGKVTKNFKRTLHGEFPQITKRYRELNERPKDFKGDIWSTDPKVNMSKAVEEYLQKFPQPQEQLTTALPPAALPPAKV